MKKIDIIIPAYKAQETMMRALSSIATQSILDQVTVTIVNDCDGIGYQKFIDKFSDIMDIREITLESNGGPGVARQKGIDETSSPYFTCMDADDTFANPFALELLLKTLESTPEHIMVSGNFIEEHLGLNFIQHPQDMIWMFGKLYKREFINKYKIRFNETRANEDNGFNTIVRLVASEKEKIAFIPDVVYYWHWKEDSITRINDAQYSYDQSFCGYTDNMIYAIKHAKKVKPLNGYIDMWAIQTMFNLYVYYYQTLKRDNRFAEQNYKYCIKYYKEIYKDYMELERDITDKIFAETLVGQAPQMQDLVADKTIYQFIDDLSKEDE